MKFGTQGDKPATEGKPASDSALVDVLGDKVHDQNTAELNRLNHDAEDRIEKKTTTQFNPDVADPPKGDVKVEDATTNAESSKVANSDSIINDTGTDAPTVDSAGKALPGTDGNAAVDSLANRQQEAKTNELDSRIEQSDNLREATNQTYASATKSDPSAADLGLDVDSATNKVEEILAESAAATAGHGTDDTLTIYSSHPIQNLNLGPYQFENSVLKLTPKQLPAFEEMLESLPMSERLNIKKLDFAKVDAIVESRRSAATQQFDSSTGRDALAELTAKFPKLGTVPIDSQTAHANVAQTDNNMEIPISEAMNKTAE